jgi:hypothetical protein
MYSNLVKQSEMEFDYEVSNIVLDEEEDRLYFKNSGLRSNLIYNILEKKSYKKQGYNGGKGTGREKFGRGRN